MILKVAIPGKMQFKMIRREPSFLLSGQGDIHYIGGAEVLPPPLESEKENEIISDLGTEYEDEAKNILIEHNLRLVVYIAKKFDNTGVGVEDLISIGKMCIRDRNDHGLFHQLLRGVPFGQPEIR